jgi:hypothetical protein
MRDERDQRSQGCEYKSSLWRPKINDDLGPPLTGSAQRLNFRDLI